MESKKGKNALQFLCSKDLVNIRVCISVPSLFEQRAGQGPDQSVTTSWTQLSWASYRYWEDNPYTYKTVGIIQQ